MAIEYNGIKLIFHCRLGNYATRCSETKASSLKILNFIIYRTYNKFSI